jgi:hypothetical protein
MAKTIRLSGHAQTQLVRRGISENEIIEAIRTSSWQPAELDRLECRKDFAYGREWNGRFYQTKQVRPIFVEEADEIVVVTVYSYYF